MSWQAFVDDQLMSDIEGGHLSAAAIIGHDGSPLAQSVNFPQFTPEDIKAIMDGFAEPASLFATGLNLGGSKYVVIQCEPGAVIHGTKGPGGVVVRKTTQALIIGIYDNPMTPGQSSKIVQRLGDYLIEQGY